MTCPDWSGGTATLQPDSLSRAELWHDGDKSAARFRSMQQCRLVRIEATHVAAISGRNRWRTQPWQYRAVRFHAEHRFTGSVEAVAALLADPNFYVDLILPDLNQPDVLESRDDGDDAMLRLRYEFAGSLDPIAQRLLGSGRLAWIQEVRVNRSDASGTLRFEAEKDPRRLHGAADFALVASRGGNVRHLDGELVVAIPGIGRMAEKRIVPGLLRRLDLEAEALDDRLR